MPALRFDITLPDGSRESLQTDAERVLIGRGAHCEIRLPEGEYAREHVIVERVGDALRVVARAFTPPPLLDGDPIAEAVVSAEAELAIGPVTIEIRRLETSDVARPATPSRATPVLRIAILIATATLGWLLLARASRTSDAAPAAIPQLWSDSPPPCPVPAAQARAMALEKRIVADGKRERHPFYACDGVEAVTLYETAAACFRLAGDPVNADELSATARQLRAEVTDDFRVRRLRLERALAAQDEEVAAQEVVMLRGLLQDRPGPYNDWLNGLARKLEVDKESP